MLWGIGKITAQNATDGRYHLHIGQEVGSGKAAMGSAAEIRDAWSHAVHISSTVCRDVLHQDWMCLPKVTGPVPLVDRHHTASAGFPWEQGNWQRPHQALVTISTYSSAAGLPAKQLQAVNACSLRNSEWWQELCLSQKVHVLSAARECPVTCFRLRGWEWGWRCVGPRSGDTITAMSSCVLIPEPVRAWWDWGHRSQVSSTGLLFLHPRLCMAFFRQADSGVLARWRSARHDHLDGHHIL